MRRIMIGVFLFAISLLATTVYATNPVSTPIGYWKTIDDVTGKPKSIVHIWKAENNNLMGKVIKLYPREGTDPNRVCSACEGHLRNQPIVGMIILSGLKASEAQQWGSGHILDPENGKTYSCSLRTSENGKKLAVKGYIGIPLLGRSQTWERVDLMSDK
ncbi:MAG: DUF2147 domain-containing protein [Gammaproteobacteria bacterium]